MECATTQFVLAALLGWLPSFKVGSASATVVGTGRSVSQLNDCCTSGICPSEIALAPADQGPDALGFNGFSTGRPNCGTAPKAGICTTSI